MRKWVYRLLSRTNSDKDESIIDLINITGFEEDTAEGIVDTLDGIVRPSGTRRQQTHLLYLNGAQANLLRRSFKIEPVKIPEGGYYYLEPGKYYTHIVKIGRSSGSCAFRDAVSILPVFYLEDEMQLTVDQRNYLFRIDKSNTLWISVTVEAVLHIKNDS